MIEKLFRAHSRRLQAAYDRMPPSLQNALTTARGWSLAKNRYAPDMFEFLAELRLHETWSLQQMKDYQLQAVRRTLDHARKDVPFYAALPAIEVEELNDLSNFPVLIREQVRQRADELVSKTVSNGQRVRVGTTGTTGPA